MTEFNYARHYLNFKHEIASLSPEEPLEGAEEIWRTYDQQYRIWKTNGNRFVINHPREAMQLWVGSIEVNTAVTLLRSGSFIGKTEEMRSLELINAIKDLYEKAYSLFSFFIISCSYDDGFIAQLPCVWDQPSKANNNSEDEPWRKKDGTECSANTWVINRMPFTDWLKVNEIDDTLFKNIRNAFSHSNYILHEDRIQLLQGGHDEYTKDQLILATDYLVECLKISIYHTFRMFRETGCWVIPFGNMLMPKKNSKVPKWLEIVGKMKLGDDTFSAKGDTDGSSEKRITGMLTVVGYESFVLLRTGLMGELIRRKNILDAYLMDCGYRIDWNVVLENKVKLEYRTNKIVNEVEYILDALMRYDADLPKNTVAMNDSVNEDDNDDGMSVKDLSIMIKSQEMFQNIEDSDVQENLVRLLARASRLAVVWFQLFKMLKKATYEIEKR